MSPMGDDSFTQSSGGRTYRVAQWGGSACPPLLGLHGFTGAGSDFAPLAPLLERPLYAPDLLGHGGSDAPREPQAYAFTAQADSIPHLAQDLGLSRPVLLGYSFGGRLALGALTQEDSPFSAAVLVGATAGLEEDADRQQRAQADAVLASSIERDGVEAFLAQWAQKPIIASQARIAAAHKERMQQARREHHPWGLAHALREAGTGAMPSLWRLLSQITVPVLLLTGAEDAAFGALAVRLAAHIPNAVQVTIPGAGHCAHLERPEDAAEAICSFLADCDGSGAPTSLGPTA